MIEEQENMGTGDEQGLATGTGANDGEGAGSPSDDGAGQTSAPDDSGVAAAILNDKPDPTPEPSKQPAASSQDDLSAMLDERLSAFSEKFEQLEKMLGKKPEGQAAEDRDYFQEAIDRRIQESMTQERNQHIQVDYERRMKALSQQYPEDFKNKEVSGSMQRIANGGMTPEELFFAANHKGIITRERKAAIEGYKKEVLRRYELTKASSEANGTGDNGGKPVEEMSFDEIAERNFNKFINSN